MSFFDSSPMRSLIDRDPISITPVLIIFPLGQILEK
jgi:hypothetical protein